MFNYKILPVESLPAKITTTPEEFLKEWKACWGNPSQPLDRLLEIVDPFLDNWVNMLTIPGYPKDINYLSLCHFVSPDPEQATKSISAWVARVKESHPLKLELKYLFVELIRTTRLIPHSARPIMALYIMARSFKLKVRHNIRTNHVLPTEPLTENLGDSEPFEDPKHPDYMLLKSFMLGTWESYLLFWLRTGYSTNTIARHIRLPRETFYYEEKNLWLSLKATFCD